MHRTQQPDLKFSSLSGKSSISECSSLQEDSFTAKPPSSNRLKLNLQISEKALKEYSRRTKELSEINDMSIEKIPPKPICNVSSLIKQIQSLSILANIEETVKLNQELERENWVLSSHLEESYRESYQSIHILENNLVSVLKYHERFFQSHQMNVKSMLENHEEKIKTLFLGLIESVNSRLAYLEYKLGGITNFSKTLKHSLTSSKVEYMDLESNFKDVISDKQYLSEKLDEGFQLTKYLQNAIRTLGESKEFFEKVANVYQSKKSYEIFFEKIQFFENCLEELQKHAQQANPYRKKLALLEQENEGLYQEIERLKIELQKKSIKDSLEIKIQDSPSEPSPIPSPRYSLMPNLDLTKTLPPKIVKIFQKFEKMINSKVVKKLSEGAEKLETMKISVKKAKLVQVSMKKRLLEFESREKNFLRDINKLSSENSRLGKSLEESKEKLKIFSNENDELNQKIEKVFKDIQSRNSEKSSLLTNVNEMKLKVSQCESEIKQLKKTNEKVFYEYEKVTAENQQNLIKRQEITLVCQTLEDKLRSQQQIIDQGKVDKESLLKKNEGLEKSVKMYLSALESFENRIKDMEIQNKAKFSEDESKFNDLMEAFEKSQSDLFRSQALVKDLEVQNWNLEQSRQELAAKIKELKQDSEKIRGSRVEFSKDYSLLSTSRAKNEDFVREMENSNRKSEKLMKKLEKYKTGLLEKDKINEELSGVVEKCFKEIELYQSKYNSYKSKAKKLKKNVLNVVSTVRNLHDSLKSSAQEIISDFFADLNAVSGQLLPEPAEIKPTKKHSRRKKTKKSSTSSEKEEIAHAES